MAKTRHSDRTEITITVTAERAAAALELPYSTFQDKVKSGEIPHIVVGGGPHRQHRRFLLEDLRAWALHNRVPADWEVSSGPDVEGR